MIITLLAVTFVVAFAIASIVVLIFSKPVSSMLNRVISDETSQAWARYLKFAIYVVGIGGGVRPWAYEKYLPPQDPYGQAVQLTPDRWVLEIYETIMGTLQSTAWLLLIFFVFALIALVVVRALEQRRPRTES